jgi:hypothetical protein
MSLELGLDGRGSLRVLLPGLVQRRLRFVDRLLPAFTLLLPGGPFVCLFTLAPFLLLFEGERGLSLCSLVNGAGRGLVRLACGRLSSVFRRRPDWSAARHAR